MPMNSAAPTAGDEPKLANGGKQREVADENSSSSSSDLKLKIDVDEETDTAKQTTLNNKTDKVLNKLAKIFEKFFIL